MLRADSFSSALFSVVTVCDVFCVHIITICSIEFLSEARRFIKCGQRSVTFDELKNAIKKENTHVCECLSSFKSGEPNSITKEPIYVGCNFGFIVYL